MKLLAQDVQNLELKLKEIRKYVLLSNVKVKMSKAPKYFKCYRNIHGVQINCAPLCFAL